MYGFHERRTCRLCQSPELRDIYDFGSVPVGDRYRLPEELSEDAPHFPLLLRHCISCGHWQLSGVVDPNLLYGNYIYETGTSPGLIHHFQAYASSVQGTCELPSTGFVVDIGSNSGVLLQQFQLQGFRVLGVEPSATVARGAHERGIPTRNNYFTLDVARELALEFGQASLITANNVLANMDDMDAAFTAMTTLLDESGVIVVETGYALDTIGQFIIDNIYHEHISYFAVAPMQGFLQARSLRLFHVERVATKGGSIRMFICRSHSPRPESESVQDLIQLETELGFQGESAGTAFRTRVESMKETLRTCLESLAAHGALVGYGASVGVTTLLYWLEAGPWFEYLVDDNPIKQGRFSPGLNLPVYSPASLLEKKPQFVVNLAWRYQNFIQQKNHAYLAQGGRLQRLLPWPS